MGFSVAACSGAFAALASVFSKVALEDGGILIRATICPWIQEDYCDTASTLIHTLSRSMPVLFSVLLCTYQCIPHYPPRNYMGLWWGFDVKCPTVGQTEYVVEDKVFN